jgi:serine/threonine protein kinase
VTDIAQGLAYLHNLKPAIVHGDLKGVGPTRCHILLKSDLFQVNILITPSFRASLADFGLATVKDSKAIPLTATSSIREAGTLRWQAPELFSEDQSVTTTRTDVYAFGCVCYEVFFLSDTQTTSHCMLGIYWENSVLRDWKRLWGYSRCDTRQETYSTIN